MPGWLQGFANNQPVSETVNMTRALLNGQPVHHALLHSVLWSLAILVVFVVISVRLYSRVSS